VKEKLKFLFPLPEFVFSLFLFFIALFMFGFVFWVFNELLLVECFSRNYLSWKLGY